MVKFIIGAIIFGLIAIAIIVMLVINFTYRSVKKLRQEVEDNYYRNQQYEQREQPKRENPFGDDYFKGAQQEQPKQQAEKKDTARKTTTSSGVTIIDDRDQERKIFDHSDGEYVEFEEV